MYRIYLGISVSRSISVMNNHSTRTSLVYYNANQYAAFRDLKPLRRVVRRELVRVLPRPQQRQQRISMITSKIVTMTFRMYDEDTLKTFEERKAYGDNCGYDGF